MILDTLENAARYATMHPKFAAAFEFLRRSDLAGLPDGKHLLDGETLFVMMAHDAGRSRSGARLEAHRKYIDIQYCIAGREEIGWLPTAECTPAEGYDAGRDLEFFNDSADSWLAVPAGRFAIFYPEDAHAPLAGEGLVHKAVVKVRLGP